jgi:hypothetical protein
VGDELRPAGPRNLSGYASAAGFRMTFDAYFNLDSGYDFASIQYSTDGTTFTTVPPAFISGYTYVTNNSIELNCWSPNYTSSGHEPAWRQVIVDLEAWVSTAGRRSTSDGC